MRVAYHRGYNIRAAGIERLHPFDTIKFARAWDMLGKQPNVNRKAALLRVDRPANNAELSLVHTSDYLKRIREPKELAGALEVPQAAHLPSAVLSRLVLRPMLLQVRGTILAAQAAMRDGLAVNLGGGFHHAKPNNGEGFCVFNDIAIAIQQLRQSGALNADDKIAYIDLDAHQGNGVSASFVDDPRVLLFDAYNRDIYPSDQDAQRRIDHPIALPGGQRDAEYLGQIEAQLPRFLDGVSPVQLAIYNAGTDIYEGDQLGDQCVSAAGVFKRDVLVFKALRERGIPAVMVTSGGYSSASYQMIGATVTFLLQQAQAE